MAQTGFRPLSAGDTSRGHYAKYNFERSQIPPQKNRRTSRTRPRISNPGASGKIESRERKAVRKLVASSARRASKTDRRSRRVPVAKLQWPGMQVQASKLPANRFARRDAERCHPPTTTAKRPLRSLGLIPTIPLPSQMPERQKPRARKCRPAPLSWRWLRRPVGLRRREAHIIYPDRPAKLIVE